MSAPGKDSWHPASHPQSTPSEQSQSSSQQQSSAQGASNLPSHQQAPHRTIGPGSYQPSSQGPVLPPPREIGSGTSFYNQTTHAHPLPLPGLSAASHPSYSLPGLGTASSTHGPPAGSAPPGLPQPGNQQSQSREPPTQTQGQQPSQQLPQGPQHPGLSNTSPPTAVATVMGMRSQISPPIAAQVPQLTRVVPGQGPPPTQPATTGTSQQHPLGALPNAPQPSPVQSGPAQLVAGAGQATPGQIQGPPSGGQGAPGNGPGGPILNDALSYLDQVKYQFQDQPDVYNKFLDIMKDFKSQAIDTPGVIDRVSTLFSGHPSLIQGFNTFLPPGYRIECSQDPRDTKITVTTPSGIHHASSGDSVSIGGSTGMALAQGSSISSASGQPPSRFYDQQGSRWGAVEGIYGPYGHASAAQHAQGQQDAMEIARQQQLAHAQAQAQAQAQHAQVQHQQAQQHQQSVQQGVNQLQTAAAQSNGSSTGKGPTGPMGPASGPGTPGVGERGKGPVEFNHAISYVNKIKNRFAHQPEIYKNFLEILQTYQRESKPIQDVYSQVTQLFREAPDLLEDFKQFLPESAAQARAAAAAKAAAEDVVNGPGSMGPSGPSTRLPAVGTFPPPPSVPKEKGKKRAQAASQIDPKGDSARVPNKRHKITHPKPSMEQQIANLSPTLTPSQPEPLGSPPQVQASIDELAFFDRVKKFIGNKQTYNEFLKLLNLFSQGLMDKPVLHEKVRNFIGGNRELLEWFKRFIQMDTSAEEMMNLPQTMNKVRLSVCRALGPSYRLLPKLEAQKRCSGRDEMCNEVLNDKWASHPTWASEDSGFVAHKKNQYEDVLHRIEEERHDYDFNVESNLRTIQLLEPIAQRIASMGSEEKDSFRLQPGLEGQSKTIYQRVIKKVWGKDAGLEIIEALHNNPVKAVPLVLGRLKKKDEEWKAAQREWQKVWRDQTVRVFWKSLDHQGITIKSNDKKQFQLKALVAEIMAKRDEQLNRKMSATAPPPEYQFVYTFPDTGIILDVSRLLAIALENGSGFSISDREKIHGFIKSFIPLFFGISQRDVEDTVNSVSHKSDDEDSEDVAGGSESPTRRPRARQDTDLLRDVLKRRSKGSRKDQEGSVASRDSSIDPHDGDVEMVNAPAERPAKEEGNWISKPTRYLTGLKPGNVPMSPVENEERNKITKRTVYSMFCNGTIYGFFRAFQILYDRLSAVKASELAIRADVEAHKMQKVARELNILPTRIEDIFPDTGPNANYYSQTLEWCEKLLEGEVEASNFEESLRTGLVQTGWKLYTIEKTCNAILKFIQNIVPSDSREKNPEKEKTADIVLRYQKDRERTEISRDRGEYQELIAYRRTVEGILGSQDDLYRIDWHEDTKTATIGVVGRDSPTITAELDRDERWNYYTQAYMMVAPTEGVPLERCRPVFLRRSFPGEAELSNADRAPGAIFVKENMEVRICVNTYRLFFMPGTEDLILKDRARWAKVPDGAPKKRAERWRGVLDGLVRRGAPDGERARNQEGWDAFVRGRVPSEPRKRKAEGSPDVGGPVSPKRQRSVPAEEDVDMGGV